MASELPLFNPEPCSTTSDPREIIRSPDEGTQSVEADAEIYPCAAARMTHLQIGTNPAHAMVREESD